jgi:hypothetical protein
MKEEYQRSNPLFFVFIRHIKRKLLTIVYVFCGKIEEETYIKEALVYEKAK